MLQFAVVFVFVIALAIIGTLVALGGQAGLTGSIVGSQTVYTKPNVTDITSALQAGNVGVPHFAINTLSVVTDSNGIRHNQVSSFLNLTPATLVGPNGILLDKGSIQTQVFAVGDNNQQMVVSGLLSVYLDTRLVAQQHITGQGITVNKNLPLLLDGNPTLNFTFADEGTYNWGNNTNHSYSIYLSNIQATVGSGTDAKVYSYYGQFLAYVLNAKVDNTRIVESSIYGSQVSILKADDTVEVRAGTIASCPESGTSACPYIVYGGTMTYPDVKVSSNGVSLGEIIKTTGVISNVARNSAITITVDGKSFNLQTPLTQNQYLIKCDSTQSNSDLNADVTVVTITGYSCTSNFGYSGTGK